ncbi:MAG: hypothetical protein M3044_02010 [Thermoproteota archaeon]|nr:hypothetical protein [Thermoproteota archaeon]
MHGVFGNILLKIASKETYKNSLFVSSAICYSFITRVKEVDSRQRALFPASGAASLLFLFITTLLLSPSIFAFGQNTGGGANQSGSVGSSTGNNSNSTLTTAGTGSQPPIATKISDKGIYQVQLTFISTLPTQSPNLLSKSGFQMEIDFLNASAPAPTSKTNSSLGMLASQPNIIQRLVPVDSFDMTIYSNIGKVLWNKTNEAATGGRGTETVSFNGSYTGPITILINNIKSSNVMTDVTTPLSTPTPANTSTPSTPAKGTTVDSIRFTSKLT